MKSCLGVIQHIWIEGATSQKHERYYFLAFVADVVMKVQSVKTGHKNFTSFWFTESKPDRKFQFFIEMSL